MGSPAAREGDTISSIADMYIVAVPTFFGPIMVPLPHPFKGELTEQLSSDVYIMGKPAATVGSWGHNDPAHVAMGLHFQREPSNRGSVFMGSTTVRINGQFAARNNDPVLTCNDPVDLPVGTITVAGQVTVTIG